MSKKRLSPNQIAEQNYNKISTGKGLNNIPEDRSKFFDTLGNAPINYNTLYSPAPYEETVFSATRVDFGEDGYKRRLAEGLSAVDNPEDVYYENQGGLETFGKAVGRIASSAVLKGLQGVAFLGSGVTESGLALADTMSFGLLEKLGYDGEFNLDDITDNSFVNTFFKAEEFMNENFFKVYQPSNWGDKSFFEQVQDGAWWANEGADGIAFALSNFIPGAMIGKAGIGVKTLSGLARGIEGGANLIGKAGRVVGLADAAGMNAFTKFATAGKAGVLRGAKIGDFADQLAGSSFMTASEAIFEAKDTGDTIVSQELQKYNSQFGTNYETLEDLEANDPNEGSRIRERKGSAMKATFFGNMAALSASNWIQMGLLNKVMGKTSKGFIAENVESGGKFLDPLQKIQRKGLDKFFNDTRLGVGIQTVASQMATEGLYEENIQHAIQNVSQNLSLNGKIDTLKFMEEVGHEVFTNLFDKEAWKSIGAGMVIGGLFGGTSAQMAYGKDRKALTEAIEKINKLSNNVLSLGQMYKTDENGNVTDQVDTEKVQNFVANMIQAKNIQDIHDTYKERGQNEIADMVKNEHIANYVKGFMEVGLEEDLRLRMKNLDTFTEEDMIKFGFDPIEFNENGDKVSVDQRKSELQAKVNDYIQQYNKLDNIIPSSERARKGEALSWYARYKHLQGLESKLEAKTLNLAAVESDSAVISAINSLADRRAILAEELENQRKFSLPKRIEQTEQALVLLDIEIEQAKLNAIDELNNAKIDITPGSERLNVTESPEALEIRQAQKTLVQVKNAIADAKDNYDALVTKNGSTFYEQLVRKLSQIADEMETREVLTEGDYIEVTDAEGNTTKGFVTVNENGENVFGSQVINDYFYENNQVNKPTEEEIQSLKDASIEEFRKKSIANKIENQKNPQLQEKRKQWKETRDKLIESQLRLDDFVTNREKGNIRLSKKEYAKELRRLEKDVEMGEAQLEALEEEGRLLSEEITELKYLYDTPETIEEVQDLIAQTEQEIKEVEEEISFLSPIVRGLKSVYYSLIRGWKSMFPDVLYKSLEDRALEIQDAIERGVDPANYEAEAIGIANKLSDYSDYKEDLQLSRKEMVTLEKDLKELETLREALYDRLAKQEQRLKMYEAAANKYEYTKELVPENAQRENPVSPAANSGSAESFKSNAKKDIKTALFSTTGKHTEADRKTLTTSTSQLRWFKFAEGYNPKDNSVRLRTVTINDPEYGVGSENDIFSEDDPKFKHENHVKVIAVNQEGNPIGEKGSYIFTSLVEVRENGYPQFENRSELSNEELETLYSDYASLINKAKRAPQYLEITSRSHGFPVKGTQLISIKKAFGTEFVSLRVVTEPSTIIDNEVYPLEKGLVYADYKGRPVGLVVRKTNEAERTSLIKKLKEYAQNRGKSKDKEVKQSAASILKQITSVIPLIQRKDNEEMSIYFLKGEDKLVFGDTIITHEQLLSGEFDIQLDMFLANINHHVNNDLLRRKEEFTDVHGNKWKNYNEYLVKEREGSPLMSDLVPNSSSIYEPQFTGTYLTFSNAKKKTTVNKNTPVGQGKQKGVGFAEGLNFTVITPGGLIQREEVEAPQNTVEEIEESEEVEPTLTASDILGDDTDVPGFSKDDLADILATAASMKSEIAREAEKAAERLIEDESTSSTSNDDIGSDSLFDEEDFNLLAERVDNTQKADLEAEEAWFRKNISSKIPFRKVQGLIDGKAYGKFTKFGEVLISDIAAVGTTYHEAFHVVSQLFLSKQEREELYAEWREKNKKQETSNTEVEEALAEEFREFMMTKQTEYTLLEKLANFIKELLGLSKDKKQLLFSRIKSGAFVNREPITRPGNNFYSLSKTLGSTAKKEILDGMTVLLLQSLFKNGFSLKDIKAFNKKNLGEEQANRFKNIYNNTFEGIIYDINKYGPAMVNNNMSKKEFIKLLRENKKEILQSHIASLKQYGTELQLEEESSVVNENGLTPDAINEEARERDSLGIINAIEFSTKSTMPPAIKILIASLPKSKYAYKNENGRTLKAIRQERSSLGLLIPTDYRRNVAILHNTLAGITSFENQLDEIKKLQNKIPEFKYLIERLNAKDSSTKDDFYLQSAFKQQFDKNRFNFFIQIYDENGSYIQDANSNRMMDLIQANWEGALRRNSEALKVVNGIYFLNQDYLNKYKEIDKDDVKGHVLSFYKDLGITFSNPDNVNLSVLGDSMQAILNTLKDRDITADIFDSENSIKGYLNRVIEEEVRTSLDYSDNQHINPENKTVYNISLHDYNSIIINLIKQEGTPAHLVWDEKTQQGNPLVRHSRWIGQAQKLSPIILEGANSTEIGVDGKVTAKLNTGETALLQFTSIMTGLLKGGVARFPFLRAGDKSLEKGFTFNEGLSEITAQEANEIMRGYLADEMLSAFMLNVEGIGEDIETYKTKGKTLRLFEGVLNKKEQKEADRLMNLKTTRKQAIKFIDEFVQRESVKEAISKYLDTKVNNNIKVLLDNKIVVKVGNQYVNLGLPTEILELYGVADKLTNGQMTALMSQFTYQSLIANIEQTKLFTGDVAFFKDFFKRTSGLVGTGKIAWVGNYVDKLLNTLFPRPDKESDSKINSIVFDDVVVASAIYNDYLEAYKEAGFTEDEAKAILKDYQNNTEADAQGYMTLPEYREFNLRLGDWNTQREEVYHKVLNGEQLLKSDILMLNPEKPQMYAPQLNEGELYAPTFYKFSVMPLLPKLIKGRNLSKLNKLMLDNGIGLATFVSGNKVGARNVQPFYKEDGEFNNEATVSHIIDYRFIKKQLDINPIGKDKVIFGTQFRKLILTGLGLPNKFLTIKGKKVSGRELINEYNELINRKTQLLTQQLIKELGIVETPNNQFKISNVTRLRELLINQSISRNATDNQLESLGLILKDGNMKPMELSINRNKMEQVLASLVNNKLIKQEVRGGALVQVSSTGLENKARKQSEIDSTKWGANLETLKFYTSTETGTTAMEVYLPHKYKEFVGMSASKVDKRLLEMIAFRIPTQGLNSIEAIKVKGFLPKEAGDIIVVPTEGVTKSGWDFDVDKLNVFFPYYTLDKETKLPIYLEYNEDTKNDVRAIQNRLIELSRSIILAKENFIPLTTPNTTKDLTSLKEELVKLNEELGTNENDQSRFMDWDFNLKIRDLYLAGKAGVGTSALQNVHHVLSQISDLKMKITRMNLKSYAVEENDNLVVSLGQEKDVNNKFNIQDIISQVLNGFVDIAKDPFLKVLNITPETSSIFFYLLRVGVPLKDITLFLNQPIIRDYLNELQSAQSLFLEEDLRVKKEKVAQDIIAKWGISGYENDNDWKAQLETSKLESYIRDKGKNKEIQVSILEDFLHYESDAFELSNLIQATTFDTSTASSIEAAKIKIDKFDLVYSSDRFINLDKLLNQTFLGTFFKTVRDSSIMFKDLFITESNPLLNDVIAKLRQRLIPIRNIDVEKELNIAKNDLLSFLLQNAKVGKNKIGSFINAMFIDKTTSLGVRLATLKSLPELESNFLIRELSPILATANRTVARNSEDINNVKMFTKRLTTEEQNLITDGWRELLEYDKSNNPEINQIVQDFAYDLAIGALLQSGLNNSPLSFTQFIPNEYYVPLASKMIEVSNVVTSKNLERFLEMFYQNNYRNKALVPTDLYGKIQNGELKSTSNRPYVKKYIKATKSYRLFKNTYEFDGKYNIFTEINKLGDGFNFKEYSSAVSVLSSNTIGQSKNTVIKSKTTPNAKTVTKDELIEFIESNSEFTREQKDALIERVSKMKNRKQVAEILKQICK